MLGQLPNALFCRSTAPERRVLADHATGYGRRGLNVRFDVLLPVHQALAEATG
jgi:hypothetical protein